MDKTSEIRTSEIRDFLVSRRARVSPERAGVPQYGRKRRVSGLRREDVALVADISVEYYTRFERGNARGASDDVLDAVSAALQLDGAEREHLFDLVRANAERPPRRPAARARGSPEHHADRRCAVHRAGVRDERPPRCPLRECARGGPPPRPLRWPGTVSHLFLDPRAKTFYADWDTVAHDIVAMLRGEAGCTPSDRALSDLVGLLCPGRRQALGQAVQGVGLRPIPGHRPHRPAGPDAPAAAVA